MNAIARRMQSGHTVAVSVRILASLVGLALSAAVLGFACGQAVSRTERRHVWLRPGPLDDGEGFLAQASRSIVGMGGLAYGMGELDSNAEPDDGSMGGTEYGGTRYGNYRFVWPDSLSRSPQLPPHRGHDAGYRAIPIGAAGSIVGSVLWPHPPRVAMLTSPGRSEKREHPGVPGNTRSGCSPAASDNLLEQDDKGHVAGALVYLEAIDRGRAGLVSPALRGLALQTGGTLHEEECQLVPRLQVVTPIGATLFLQGGSPTARTWVGMLDGRVIFRRNLIAGAREQVLLGEAGLVEIHDEGGTATAWVMVASHPYFTITGPDGQFRLDEVPPGHYTLVVWHPPVVSRPQGGNERVPSALTEPVVVKRQVTVHAGRESTIDLRLPAI